MYTVSDGVLTDTATVIITVTSVNDDPDAVDDSTTAVRDSAAAPIGVLGNDTDVENDPLLIIAKTNGVHGTVAITGGGTGLTYDPFTGHSGLDTFTYTIDDGNGGTDSATVSVTIAGENRAPNAVNDVGVSVPEGAAATAVDVLANDDDPDGDSFTIIARTNGAHGTVAITGGGTGLTYDPATLYDGPDTFTYTIRDPGGKVDTATVVVTVVRDTAAPIVVAPAQRFLGQTVGSTLRARITWSATDAGSGIKSYTAQVSTNGGTWTTIPLVTPTRNFVDRSLTDGRSYRFRVRATDREGNVSPWRYSVTFRPARFQESTSLATYVGTWGTSKSAQRARRGRSHRLGDRQVRHVHGDRVRHRARLDADRDQRIGRPLRGRRLRVASQPASDVDDLPPADLHPPLGHARRRTRSRSARSGRAAWTSTRSWSCAERSAGRSAARRWRPSARSCYTTAALIGRP